MIIRKLAGKGSAVVFGRGSRDSSRWGTGGGGLRSLLITCENCKSIIHEVGFFLESFVILVSGVSGSDGDEGRKSIASGEYPLVRGVDGMEASGRRTSSASASVLL